MGGRCTIMIFMVPITRSEFNNNRVLEKKTVTSGISEGIISIAV